MRASALRKIKFLFANLCTDERFFRSSSALCLLSEGTIFANISVVKALFEDMSRLVVLLVLYGVRLMVVLS